MALVGQVESNIEEPIQPRTEFFVHLTSLRFCAEKIILTEYLKFLALMFKAFLLGKNFSYFLHLRPKLSGIHELGKLG